MNKQAFINELRIALSGSLMSHTVDEHVKYYQEYIELEIRKGRMESEIIASLGSPKLLAKSIIEVNKEDDVYEAIEPTCESGDTNHRTIRSIRLNWIIMILIVIAVFLVVGSLFITFLPYLLVIFAAIQIAKIFSNYRKK